MRRKRTPVITRDQAVAATPIRTPSVKEEEKNAKLYITIEFERPKWQRVLGADSLCQRTFGLDEYGQDVYASCDGETSITDIVRIFAGKHKMSIAESELSVMTFLKTMMTRGLIGMTVPKEAL